jgi:hypothetical protein
VKCGIYLFLSSFWKRQVHSHRSILVTGSVIWFYFLFLLCFCLFDLCTLFVYIPCTCLQPLGVKLSINKVKIGKQEPGTPFSKLLDLHLMQQWFMGYFHKTNLKITIDHKLYWIVHCVSIIIVICICPSGALIWLINLF